MANGFARLGLLFLLTFTAGTAQAVTVGDLLISEVMANPAAVADSRGEWLELYNPTAETVNLRDITIGDDGGDAHRIESDLLVLPGHFLTLARNGDAAVNGGFQADYVYTGFNLGNGADEIVFSSGLTELLRLDYGGNFVEAGRTRELIGVAVDANNYALTLATLTYGLGDIGTPGMAGSAPLAPSPVPLPAAAWLFFSGMLALAGTAGRHYVIA